MLRVAIHDLFTLDVTQIMLEYLLFEKVYERLNVFGHLAHILSSIQLGKIDFREGSLEELDVELIAKEYSHVIDWLLNPQISEDVVSQLYDDLHDYIIMLFFKYGSHDVLKYFLLTRRPMTWSNNFRACTYFLPH